MLELLFILLALALIILVFISRKLSINEYDNLIKDKHNNDKQEFPEFNNN